jgi:hypothetical protein
MPIKLGQHRPRRTRGSSAGDELFRSLSSRRRAARLSHAADAGARHPTKLGPLRAMFLGGFLPPPPPLGGARREQKTAYHMCSSAGNQAAVCQSE